MRKVENEWDGFPGSHYCDMSSPISVVKYFDFGI